MLVVAEAQIKVAKGYALLAVPVALAGPHVQAEGHHLESVLWAEWAGRNKTA